MASRDPRAYLQQLRRAAERSGDFVRIPQPFPEPAVVVPRSALGAAFLNGARRMDGEIPATSIHPVCWASARSPDSTWSESFYAIGLSPGALPELVDLQMPEDLSEVG